MKVEESVINVLRPEADQGHVLFPYLRWNSHVDDLRPARSQSGASQPRTSNRTSSAFRSSPCHQNEDMPTPLDDSRPRLVFECANATFRFGGPDEVKTQVEVEKAVLSHKVSLVAHDMMTKIANTVLQETTEAQLHVQD